MKKTFPSSQLIINEDGSIFHLHIRPEHLADKVILVGDQGRVDMVASFFDEGSIECNIQSREFHTITGKYKGKRISCISTGIGTDNCDIVMNELDALANINFVTRTRKRTIVPLKSCVWAPAVACKKTFLSALSS
jgi:uridine phosphorylase